MPKLSPRTSKNRKSVAKMLNLRQNGSTATTKPQAITSTEEDKND